MKTTIHVHQQRIRTNKDTGAREPVISVRDYLGTRHGNNVRIHGASEVVYSPDQPQSCGARVWIETEHPAEIVS